MMRLALFTFVVLAFGIDSLAFADCNSEDPLTFGVQVTAKMNGDGAIKITRTNVYTVCRPETKTETRTKTVERNGEQVTLQENVNVTVMICETKTAKEIRKVPAAAVRAFDTTGKPIARERLTEALKEESIVLFATRELSPFYLTVYKPDTILLVTTPMAYYSSPGEGHGGPIAVPVVPAPAPIAPLPPATPVVPMPPAAPLNPNAPGIPAPPAIPVPRATATALLQPGATADASALLVGVSPFVVLAHAADGNVNVRQYVKETTTEKIAKEVNADGVKKLVYMDIKVEKVNDVERQYPLGAVTITRADKQPISPEQIAQQLSKTTCVLKSGDGGEISPQFLKIVRPEALILVAPQPIQQPPQAFPAPVAPAVPAGLPTKAPIAAPATGA